MTTTMLTHPPALNPVTAIVRKSLMRTASTPRTDRRGTRTRPIEDIQIGDHVWAWDEQRGESVHRPVVRLFRHQGKPIVAVTVASDDGAVQRIECTTEHPFWVDGKGWVAACKLEAGDELKRIDGGACLRVVSSKLTGTNKDVFNFEVSQVHNYFVGRQGVLVHNESGPPPPTIPGIDGRDHGAGAFVSLMLAPNSRTRTPARITGFVEADGVMYPTVEIAKTHGDNKSAVVFAPLTLSADQAASIRGSTTSEKIFSGTPSHVAADDIPAYTGGAIPQATLRIWAKLPAPRQSALMTEALQIGDSEPLFRRSEYGPGRYLAVNGRSMSIETTMTEVLDTYLRYSDLAENPGGLLLHGSTSASLLSITQRTGGLLPTGELLKLNKPPMAGELVYGIGRGGVNRSALSTVFVTHPAIASRYAIEVPSGGGWSPEIGIENIRSLSEIGADPKSIVGSMATARLEIERQRLQFWDQLNSSERGLVHDNYPVVWRMRPAPTRQLLPVRSDIPREIAVVGGVNWAELSEIRVPENRVDDVRSLLTGQGLQTPVLTIEAMMRRAR